MSMILMAAWQGMSPQIVCGNIWKESIFKHVYVAVSIDGDIDFSLILDAKESAVSYAAVQRSKFNSFVCLYTDFTTN